MVKTEFINRRTKIISRMLDHPNEYGIYPTTECFAALDDLFDELVKQEPSGAQLLREGASMDKGDRPPAKVPSVRPPGSHVSEPTPLKKSEDGKDD